MTTPFLRLSLASSIGVCPAARTTKEAFSSSPPSDQSRRRVLLRWRSQLPNWAILTAAAGTFFAAANAWYVGTVAVAVADSTTDTPFEDIGESTWFLAGSAPKMLLCLAGFVALGIGGWRQRSIPRGAAALLVLAGLASAVIPPFPPGVLLSSIAFYWIAGSAASRTAAAQL